MSPTDHTPTASRPVTQRRLLDALAFETTDGGLVGVVEDGWDVFSVPHGGYLAALVGSAALTASGDPDLFTLTVHYLRKAAPGSLHVRAHRVGGGRRLTTWALTASQRGEPVLTALASLGDRDALGGPTWTDQPPPPHDAPLSPPAGSPDEPFPTPAIAQRFGQRLELATAGFAAGAVGDDAVVRSRLDTERPDQLTALVACDITPPAAWNVLGVQGWVPTVELTAHVRARPAPGPLSVEASTHHVAGGFLEEDALVRDASGTLVVQSRQLARWTETA